MQSDDDDGFGRLHSSSHAARPQATTPHVGKRVNSGGTRCPRTIRTAGKPRLGVPTFKDEVAKHLGAQFVRGTSDPPCALQFPPSPLVRLYPPIGDYSPDAGPLIKFEGILERANILASSHWLPQRYTRPSIAEVGS